MAELAYAVGAAHQGRDLAHRAVISVPAGKYRRMVRIPLSVWAAVVVVVYGNPVGLAEKPTVERRRKGRTIRLATWERSL